MKNVRAIAGGCSFAIALVALVGLHALADATPQPSPSATPPVPARWEASFDGMSSFIDQATNGPGTIPPEGAGFAAGNPLSPMTPYDTFSSAPTTPGVAGVGQLIFSENYSSKRLKGQVSAAFEYVNGSVTNAAYWTESLLPVLNPHVGSQALPYSVVFPTHAGQDDSWTLGGMVPSSVSLGAADDAWRIKGGWFDLTQTDRFVFVQPALTNVTPALTIAPAESLGTGSPTLDGWPRPPPGLPLNGVDLTLHRGAATAEFSHATLPALPGTVARLTLASAVVDHGNGTRFSADLLHLTTGGNIISTTTFFGANPTLHPGPQGPLPTSDLGDQQQTIAGVRAAFHATRALDATVELGRAWYDAQHVLLPGSQKPGGFYHLALSRSIGHMMASVEGFRFEPRYATAILPYGAPENVWSVAWSWPGVWLKSNYQLADNTVVGSNREGYRLRYNLDRGRVELHASFAAFHQIDTASTANGEQVGFVEGFFLPQQPAFATLGRQKQYAAWLAWHPAVGDFTLDYVDDMMHRDAAASQPQDAVSYDAPQIVVSYAHALNRSALLALGAGRYAMRGTFAQGKLTNVDFGQNVLFMGGQFAESKQATILLHWRLYGFSGQPSMFAGPAPDYHGSLLVVEQRFHT